VNLNNNRTAERTSVRYLPLNQGAFMHVRRATAADAERIAEIYNWYILNTIITFEADVVSPGK
jgi:hypothetical protein